jgi:hypothetical protein
MAGTYGKSTGIASAKFFYLQSLLCKAVLSSCDSLNEKKEEGKQIKTLPFSVFILCKGVESESARQGIYIGTTRIKGWTKTKY